MSEESALKRKIAQPANGSHDAKRQKGTWGKQKGFKPPPESIEPGDAGIWVTCNRRQEAKCVREVKFLFEEYAQKLYGISADGDHDGEAGAEGDEVDIEAEIASELTQMKSNTKKKESLFINVLLDCPCLVFIKTKNPVNPLQLVEAICRDAKESGKQRTKWARRLTPMAYMAKATPDGLHDAAQKALAKLFHEGVGRSFAIRPSIRNHGTLKRDTVIRQVAAEAGPGHKVDLREPEFTILVEIYTNILGVGVAGGDYDKLKRYNLAEIYQPTPRGHTKSGNADHSAHASAEKSDDAVGVASEEANPELVQA